MTILIDTELYNSDGSLAYKNYTSLVDGNYNVNIYEGSGGYLPPKIEFVAGDGDDILNVDTFRDLTGVLSLGFGNDVLNLASGGGDMRSGTVHGDGGNDNISGYNIALLYGDDGNDILYGGGKVFGGDGDDVLSSETDAYGGAGNDTVFAYEGTAYCDDGDDRVTGVFGAYGGSGNDIVTAKRGSAYGDAGNDIVTSYKGDAGGGDGNDVVVGYWSASGGNGDDIISVTATDEGWLYGGSGNDRLTGGAGNDLLIGGPGKDYLTGGGGADVFRFEKGDLGFVYSTRDQITDFEAGIDKIDLSAYSDANITFVHDVAYDRVKIDINGDHKTDFLIQVALVNDGMLTIGDFLLA